MHEASWPVHAKFHAITGIFCELLLCFLAILFGWKYLKKQGHCWAWGTTAAIGVVMFGGLVIANPLTHGRLSGGGETLGNPEFFNMASKVGAVTWIVTSILTRSFIQSIRGHSEQQRFRRYLTSATS